MRNIVCIEMMWHAGDGKLRPQVFDLPFSPARMDDHALGGIKYLAVQRQQKFLQARERVILTLLCKLAPHLAMVVDQIVAISLRVIPGQGEFHDEVVKNEVVQDNISGLLQGGAKDKLVKDVVPDMVQDRMIEPGHGEGSSVERADFHTFGLDVIQLDGFLHQYVRSKMLSEAGQLFGRIVRDARKGRGQRRDNGQWR